MDTNDSNTKTMMVTPEIAAKWMERNVGNRPLSRITWMGYANDMLADRWKYNGDSIRFDENGDLLDGQHRLKAVIESGVTIKTDVKLEIPRDAFYTMDGGLKRSPGQILQMIGVTNAKEVASALRLVYIYDLSGGTSVDANYANIRFSTIAVDFIEQHTEIHHSVKWGRMLFKLRLMSPSIAIAMHYLLSTRGSVGRSRQVASKAADDFMGSLASGAELSRDSPILLLRQRLINTRGGEAGKLKTKKMETMEVCAMVIKAWNAHLAGKPIVQLKWSPGLNESFPTIN